MKHAVRWMMAAAVLLGIAATVRAEPWKFAVFGDTRSENVLPGVNTQTLWAIATAVVRDAPRLVLVPGDLIQGISDDTPREYEVWRAAMSPVLKAGIPVYPVRGNHEVARDPNGVAWKRAFGALPTNGPPGEQGLTYSVAHSNALFLALDTYVKTNQVNLAWIQARLASNTLSHVFVFGHEPAFSVIHVDCLAVHPEARDRFWDLIGQAGGRVYFCGHDHMYNRASVPDRAGREVYQLVVGCGGGPLYPWRPPYSDPRVKPGFHNHTRFGYVLVTLDGPRVLVEWRALAPDGTWQTGDSFSYSVQGVGGLVVD